MSSKGPQEVENRDLVFPINTSFIPDDLKQLAERELSEDDDTRINSLKLFRSMLRDQADFRWQDEELFLLAFLRARKYDVNRAFLLMKNMYKMFQKYDDVFYNFDFKKVKRTLQKQKIGYLPYRDSAGCAIFVFQVAPWNPREVPLGDIVLSINYLFHVAVRSPVTQIAGVKLIVDFADLSAHHIPHILPYLLLASEAIQNSFPARFSAFHIVNEGFLFSSIWAVMKQFMSKKMKERWHFHGKHMKKLHKYISPSILTAEYEGELPSFENSSNLKEAEKYAEYLTHLYSLGYQDYKSNHERTNSSENSTQTKDNFPQEKSSQRKNSSVSSDFVNERKNSSELGRRLSQGFCALRRNPSDGLTNMQMRLSQFFNYA